MDKLLNGEGELCSEVKSQKETKPTRKGQKGWQKPDPW